MVPRSDGILPGRDFALEAGEAGLHVVDLDILLLQYRMWQLVLPCKTIVVQYILPLSFILYSRFNGPASLKADD